MNYPGDVLLPVKTFLEEKKAELLNRLQRLTAEDPFGDPDNRMSNNAAVDADAIEQFGHETAVAMKEEISRKLAQVDRALERIAGKTYGTCTGCGSMIDTDRLTVDPSVEQCVTCQQKKSAK
jgi:RNA polymerase-binding transcription factor DksA